MRIIEQGTLRWRTPEQRPGRVQLQIGRILTYATEVTALNLRSSLFRQATLDKNITSPTACPFLLKLATDNLASSKLSRQSYPCLEWKSSLAPPKFNNFAHGHEFVERVHERENQCLPAFSEPQTHDVGVQKSREGAGWPKLGG